MPCLPRRDDVPPPMAHPRQDHVGWRGYEIATQLSQADTGARSVITDDVGSIESDLTFCNAMFPFIALAEYGES